MEFRGSIKVVALTSLMISTFVSSLISCALLAQPMEASTLQALGIEGPFTESKDAEASYKFELNGFSVEVFRSYTTLGFDGSDGRISAPGHPMLPFKAHVVEVYGRAMVEQVGVNSFRYHVQHLSAKALPAPQPLIYRALEGQKLVHSEDEEIYSRDAYYPGRLVDYSVGYGSAGRTVIALQLYPVQYNPVSGEALVFDYLEVSVDYTLERTYSTSSESLVIITTEALKNAASSLASYYDSEVGINASVVTTESIYQTYPAADNITTYPGFYEPARYDEIYELLTQNYNWTLALKIISYLRTQSNKTHVLMMGGADTVPPSFYYQSGFMGGWFSWIPTDYFYASPDCDLIPNLYVGRIPFSDNVTAQKVVDKIISWYGTTSGNPNWTRNLDMAGGHPFLIPFMFGESAISRNTLEGYTRMFNASLLTRTGGNYNSTSIKSLLANGEIGWFTVLCHGDGESLGDYTVEEGILGLEILAKNTDLLGFSPNSELPIVTSVACDNAAWDDDLLPSSYFTPPCFGKAVLMSPAAGIAYVGSARTASELGVTFNFTEGLLKIEFYGATYIHSLIIKAYNSLMGTKTSTSLGEVVTKGLENYVTTVVSTLDSMEQSLALENLFMLSLLGDPGLQLPVYSKPFTEEQIEDVNPLNPELMLDVATILGDMYMAGYFEGAIPFYKPWKNVTIEVLGSGEKTSVYIIRTYFAESMLVGYESLADLKQTFEDGKASVTVAPNKNISGLLLLKTKVKGVEARFYMTSAGLSIEPPEATAGSTVTVKGFGLDLLTAPSSWLYGSTDSLVVLTLAGWNVSHVLVDQNGYMNWSFTLPLLKPNCYDIAVLPMSYRPNIEELIDLLKANVTITSEAALDIVVSGGDVYEPEDTVTIRILTLLAGELINAGVIARLITPNETIELGRPTQVGIGEFIVEFDAPANPATYFIMVEANCSFTLPMFFLKSCAMHSFTVTTSLKMLERAVTNASGEIIDEIWTSYGLINASLYEIERLMTDSSGEIIAEIQTSYGLINASLYKIDGEITRVSEDTVEIRNALGIIDGRITEIANGNAYISTNVGDIQVSVDKIKDESVPQATNYILGALIATVVAIVSIIVNIALTIRTLRRT